MITPSVKIIRLDWEEGQMFNLFLAITSFAVIKSEQSVERKTLNRNLIAFVFLLNTSYGRFIVSKTLKHTHGCNDDVKKKMYSAFMAAAV